MLTISFPAGRKEREAGAAGEKQDARQKGWCSWRVGSEAMERKELFLSRALF